MANRKIALITKVSRGKRKGEFRFKLKAGNGETIATSHTETYTALHNCEHTLKEHFPAFDIVYQWELPTKKKKCE